jgi:hypothetical protein
LIYAKLKERERTVAWLAKNLSYHEKSIFKIFHKEHIDTGLLLQISIVLEYDFFTYFSEEVEYKIENKNKK